MDKKKCGSGHCPNESLEGILHYVQRCQKACRKSARQEKTKWSCVHNVLIPLWKGGRMCGNCLEKARIRNNTKREDLIQLGICVRCKKDKATKSKHCLSCWTLRQEQGRKRQVKLKRLVMETYGGVRCACPGCGVVDLRFLTIDHINGGGNKHAKEHGGHLHRWLLNHDFPPGYQVLCFNCNMGRAINGGVCPHSDNSP